ncbi:hypothetical protein PENTCL1PPCAC_25847, partial [Pristionchus entomophagus]
IECLLLLTILPHLLVISIIIKTCHHLMEEGVRTRSLLSSDLSLFLQLEQSIHSSLPLIRVPRHLLPRRLPHCSCVIGQVCPPGKPGHPGVPGRDGPTGLKGADGEQGEGGHLPLSLTVTIRGCR